MAIQQKLKMVNWLYLLESVLTSQEAMKIKSELKKRLSIIVPLVLVIIIFLILYFQFRSITTSYDFCWNNNGF